MHYPDISGLIVVASGKYGSAALRYRVDAATNRISYIIRQSRVRDVVYEDYAAAREKFDEICKANNY